MTLAVRGSEAALSPGLAPGAVFRGLGRDIECLQVRLSPVVAHAALGASAEMGGTVVALSDLWGRAWRNSQPGPDGAASAYGPGSGRRSASPPSVLPSLSVSTMLSIASRRVTALP